MTSKPAEPEVSPWIDDSGPDILKVVNNDEARQLLTPNMLGMLLSVYVSLSSLSSHLSVLKERYTKTADSVKIPIETCAHDL